MNAVEFQGVSKSYAIYDSPGDRLKELLSLNRLKRHQDFWALHDVTFEVKRGETFCIVGENGSGKSTLLQMVAGILQPTPRNGRGERARFRAAGTGRRLQPGIQRPRQRLSERLHPGPHARAQIDQRYQRHRSLRRNRRLHQPAGEDLFERHGGAAGVRRGHQRGPRDPAGGRSPGGGRHLFPPALHAQGARAARARHHHSVRLARRGRREGHRRPRAVAGPRAGWSRSASPTAWSPSTWPP